MTFFQTLAVIFASALIAVLILQIKSLFLHRIIGGKNTWVTVIITVDGSPAELEQSVKGILRLISGGTLGADTEIIIKNANVSEETAEMARILERENTAVRVLE